MNQHVTRSDARALSWWQFVLIVIAYAAILKSFGQLVGGGISQEEGLETTRGFARAYLIPVAVSAAFAVGIATWLRWWPQIVSEPLRVKRWVGVVPLGLLFAALAGTSWENLADQQVSLVISLVALACLVGFTEELMFRGIGVVTFRNMGMAEGRVALYTSILFGAVHLSNAFSTGSSAFGQAVAVSFTGYMLYLTRRWAGAIWLSMPVHGSQDFAILSGQIGIDPETSPRSIIVIVMMLALGIALLGRRHSIEPDLRPQD